MQAAPLTEGAGLDLAARQGIVVVWSLSRHDCALAERDKGIRLGVGEPVERGRSGRVAAYYLHAACESLLVAAQTKCNAKKKPKTDCRQVVRMLGSLRTHSFLVTTACASKVPN
jgi:hypothetical protein